MKAKKWLSLLLVMALALPLMGPAAAIATTYDPSGLPVAPPVVSPQRPPDQPPPDQQAPPAAESYASDPSLKALVDKTEARTGDTLVFQPPCPAAQANKALPCGCSGTASVCTPSTPAVRRRGRMCRSTRASTTAWPWAMTIPTRPNTNESPEQLPEETAEQPDVGEAPPEEAADLPPESSAEAPTPPEQAEQQQPPAQEVKEEEPSKHPGGKTGQPPAQPAEETALSEGDTQNLPVKLEDLTPESTRFTAGQKALPRLGILLPDDRKDALDVYQGIITSLLHAGYVPNDNLMILVVSAKGMEGKPAEEKAALLKKMGCQLVIAVGDQMSKSARKALGDLPLVAAGVDDPFAYHFVDRQGKARGAVTGVINTPLFENLLTLIGQMQPGAGQAGVFYNLESNQVKQRRAAMDAAGIGMLYGRISATSPFEPVMKKNLAEANLFVVDQSVNERAPDELQSLVTAAAQADKPVYGTSLRQVEAGFAAACTPDYQAVGYESGRLAALILGGQPIAELPFIQLEAYLIHTNPRTLDALGLQAPLLPPAGEQVSVQKTAPGQ